MIDFTGENVIKHEAVHTVREREKPLALYIFIESKALKKYITKHVSFGGVGAAEWGVTMARTASTPSHMRRKSLKKHPFSMLISNIHPIQILN